MFFDMVMVKRVLKVRASVLTRFITKSLKLSIYKFTNNKKEWFELQEAIMTLEQIVYVLVIFGSIHVALHLFQVLCILHI